MSTALRNLSDWPAADPAYLVEHNDPATGTQLFYPVTYLVEAGYLDAEEFQVVRIGDELYELQGHVGRGKFDPPDGFWWVQPA